MLRRLKMLIAVVPVAGATALSGAAGASAYVLPPANPANLKPSGAIVQGCLLSSNSAACDAASIQAIDSARADEGVGPLALPSNYGSLTPAQQILVLFDLERIDRGVPAIAGLNPYLNQDALNGAYAGTDPSFPPGASSAASLWAGGSGTPLFYDFLWMYDDGPGGSNISTPWIHRDEILGSYPDATLMGAAVVPSSAYGQSAGVVVAAGVSSGTNFAWSQEAQYLPPGSTAGGYWLVASDGGLFSYGTSRFDGSMGAVRLNQPIVGMAATPDHGGYWMVASDGGIFSFGDARFAGSTGNIALARPMVGMSPDRATGGYWTVASDGGVFSFAAPFLGSTGNIRLNRPMVGMASTASGHGYWMVASDGGIFAYGDAPFYGSTGNLALTSPIVGMAPTPSGHGYWLVAADGGVFSFGDAAFHGSAGGINLASPIVAIAATPDGGGYWLVAANGAVHSFGDAVWLGSPAAAPLNAPVVGAAS